EPRPTVLAAFQTLSGLTLPELATGPGPAPDGSGTLPGGAASGVQVAVPAARPGAGGGGGDARHPDLAEVSRHAELLDLMDDMATALLRVPEQDGPEAVLREAARLLGGRTTDWVIADLAEPEGGLLRRAVVLGPRGEVVRREPADGGDGEPAGLGAALMDQDPADCPVVVDAVRDALPALRVRPDDTDALGRDASGASMLIRARVTSLICVPLCLPPACGPQSPALGALTLLRTGGRRAFEMAEAGVVDRISRHVALALRGRDVDMPPWASSPPP
ncbi:hypothetical protein ACSNOD_28370, partial [Streptomyces sp. URMC 123]